MLHIDELRSAIVLCILAQLRSSDTTLLDNLFESLLILNVITLKFRDDVFPCLSLADLPHLYSFFGLSRSYMSYVVSSCM